MAGTFRIPTRQLATRAIVVCGRPPREPGMHGNRSPVQRVTFPSTAAESVSVVANGATAQHAAGFVQVRSAAASRRAAVQAGHRRPDSREGRLRPAGSGRRARQGTLHRDDRGPAARLHTLGQAVRRGSTHKPRPRPRSCPPRPGRVQSPRPVPIEGRGLDDHSGELRPVPGRVLTQQSTQDQVGMEGTKKDATPSQ
jgi:hypothetical protein